MAKVISIYTATHAIMMARFEDWKKSVEAYNAAGKPAYLDDVIDHKAEMLMAAVNDLTELENAMGINQKPRFVF